MKKLKYKTLSNITFLLKDMFKVYPILVVFIFIQTAMSIVVPVLNVYLPKMALDAISTPSHLNSLIYTGIVLVIAIALKSFSEHAKYMYYNDMRTHYLTNLFYKSLRVNYQTLESPEGINLYERSFGTLVRGDWSGTSKMTVAMIDIFVNVVTFFIFTAILSRLNIVIIVILMVLTILNYLLMTHAQKYEYSYKDQLATNERKTYYLEETPKNVGFAKDIRLYGMKQFFINKRDEVINEYLSLVNKTSQRYLYARWFNTVTEFIRDALAYSYLIYATIQGTVTVSEFVLYFGAIMKFSSFVKSIIEDLTELNGANIQMNDLRLYFELDDAPEEEIDMEFAKYDIEFKNVYFSYDGSDEYQLENLSFKINHNENIALVGRNGAGKTTIVKLLCGFYKPTQGDILINGINTKNIPIKNMYELFSTVFQELYTPPFSILENISMTEKSKSNIDKVKETLQKVGMYEHINTLPYKEDTILGEITDDSIKLSGGQKQKLLMARAMYKDAPIYIFDEPTSALDPIAENETYNDFHEHSKNKTTLYISHRLASTRFCDRILFLDDKHITEEGSHHELMQIDGAYKHMFDVQSKYYKEGGKANEELQYT